MLVRDPVHSCPASKGKGLWAWFAPSECSWAERSEKCRVRGFLSPSLAQLAGQRLCRMERSGLCLLRGQWAWSWTGGSGAPEIIYSWTAPPSLAWEGKDAPSPHCMQDHKHHQRGSSEKEVEQAQEPLAGHTSAKERQKRNA